MADVTFENSIQSMYPGEIVTLIEVDATASRIGGQVYRFHGENMPFTSAEILKAVQTGTLPDKTIKFQGNTYGARPFGITGISFTGDGQATKPQLILSNMDQQVSALIRSYNGLMQAKVNIWVFQKDAMDANGVVKDTAFRKLVYYVERPNYVDPSLAKFDLTSPYDMDGIMIPPRVTQPVCYWAQRGWYKSGKGCTYNGQNGYYDKDNVKVTDPSKDSCAGTVAACKLRFGQLNELDFGGCAAASLQRKNQ